MEFSPPVVLFPLARSSHKQKAGEPWVQPGCLLPSTKQSKNSNGSGGRAQKTASTLLPLKNLPQYLPGSEANIPGESWFWVEQCLKEKEMLLQAGGPIGSGIWDTWLFRNLLPSRQTSACFISLSGMVRKKTRAAGLLHNSPSTVWGLQIPDPRPGSAGRAWEANMMGPPQSERGQADRQGDTKM